MIELTYYILSTMQSTVRDYFSQRFRNIRRKSYLPKCEHKKTVATIVPSNLASSNMVCIQIHVKLMFIHFLQINAGPKDEVSYERNHESMKNEYKKQNTNHIVMKKLLQLTHETRRLEISTCQLSLTKIIENFPFFPDKIWVKSISNYLSSIYFF